jgi:hypothetical protein
MLTQALVHYAWAEAGWITAQNIRVNGETV